MDQPSASPLKSKVEFVKKVPISTIRAISEIVADISAQKPYGKDRPVLNGTIGAPSHEVDEGAINAMIKALEESKGKPRSYTGFHGDKALRERLGAVINAEYKSRDGGKELGYKGENVLFSVGASSGLQAALIGTANEKVPVLTPSPFYLLYKSQADLVKANLIKMDTSQTNYKITPETLRASLEEVRKKQHVLKDDVRANILFNYPGNPIGTMLNAEEWQGIAEVLREYPKVNIMMDEIYRDIIVAQDEQGNPKQYTSLLHVAPDLANRTLMFFAGSKGASLAGERIGAVVGPKDAIDDLATIQFPIAVHPSHSAQLGFVEATEALHKDKGKRKWLSDYYKERVDAVKQGLGDAVIDANVEGAFYVVADLKDMKGKPFSEKARAYIEANPRNFQALLNSEGKASETINNDLEIALHLLFDHGVAISAASAFGYDTNDCKMRIACTPEPAQLKEMTAEINAALGKQQAPAEQAKHDVPDGTHHLAATPRRSIGSIMSGSGRAANLINRAGGTGTPGGGL